MIAMDKNVGDKTPPFGESSSSDSDSSSSSKNNKSEVDSDLSDDDQKSKQQQNTVGTAFDDYEMKSLDDKQYQVTQRDFDPEIQAKEDYMRKLMSFRKDELILPEESEDDEVYDLDNPEKKQKEKSITGVEDAYELVDKIEEKMNQIANVIRGMDKRMSYNLRLIGSVVMQTDDQNNSAPVSEEFEEINNLLKNKTISERKSKVIPKIKRMTQFATSKLVMNG